MACLQPTNGNVRFSVSRVRRILQLIKKQAFLTADMSAMNLLMSLAVRISSYGCTWEVWRALKKLELLRIFRALQTSRVHS